MQSLSLADGEKVNDVEVRLWRNSAISGQVLDEQNEAVEGIAIMLVRSEMTGGRRVLSLQQSAVTDDRGVYRISGLTPGDYGLCAIFSRHIAPIAASLAQQSGGADMQRTLSGSGGLSPSGSGYRVGDYMMISGSGQRNVDPAPGEDGRQFVFADACYPSAPTVQGAELVGLESGQERSQVNLQLRIVPGAQILGTIAGPVARLSGMAVHLYPATPGDSTIANAIEAAQTITDPGGGFGFIGVPAGAYVLRVTYVPQMGMQMDNMMLDRMLGEFAAMGEVVPPEILARASQAQAQPTPTEAALWASAEITVGATDVTGIALALRETPRVTGRLVFDGATKPPPADRLTTASIAFEAMDAAGTTFVQQPRGRFAADGSFTAIGLVPGRYIARLQGAWPGWNLKSVLLNGRDISDDPLEVTGSDIAGVVISMTDRTNELSGTVRGADGLPDRRARVVVFPADRARWTQANGGRRATSTVASKTGTFSFSTLPAGDYIAVAVPDQPGLNWQDPRRLDALSRGGTRVTIHDGEPRRLDLVTSVAR
jgi:hypothetical protein